MRSARTVLPRSGARPGRRRGARQRRRRRHLIVLWTLVAIISGTGSFTAGLLSATVDFTAPAPPKSALLLDSTGKVFATVRSPYQREEVPARDIPQVMRDAIVSAEDRTFFKNSGVDPLAIVRAGWKDLTGSHIQGGSTITQQYVKQVYTNQHRTVLRKVKEAALAVRLERKLSKNEILTRYLNTTYFGNGTYGVQAASKYYFGVPIADLAVDPRNHTRSDSLALGRAAMLAGLVPAPSVWNPVHNITFARQHQLEVLNRMAQDGKISAQQASDAYGRNPPVIAKTRVPETPTVAPEFRDFVRSKLEATFKEDPNQLYQGGLRVTTTLDLDLEKAIVGAIHDVLPDASDPEAAVVAIDPRSGDIRALSTRVNRKGQHAYTTGGFNLALQAERSTGSTIKPFTLSVALERGHSLGESVCAPGTAVVPNPGQKPYAIHNAEGGGGCYTLESALWHSVNTVYGPLALKVGLKRVLQRAVDAGLAPPENLLTHPNLPARSIGGGDDVTPISEATAYATLVNHGLKHTNRSILVIRSGGSDLPDSGDVVFRAPKPKGTQIVPKKVADQVTTAMQGVIDHGTATRARQDFPVYGKTGTTNDYTNAWFIGCTRSLCIATWMGFDKLHPMKNIHGVRSVVGGTLPAEIFAKSWDNYRAIKAAEKNPAAIPTPSPTHRVKTARPQPSRTPSPRPTVAPSKSAKPAPPPTSSPKPKPTCTGLLCGPP